VDAPASAPGKNATKAFAPLIDDIWLVAPGVLCRRSLAAGPNGSGFGACFGSLHAYYAYAATLPDRVAGQGAPHGGDAASFKVLASAKLTPDKAAKLGLRVLARFEERGSLGVQIALGLIEETPVWLYWRYYRDRVIERSLVTIADEAPRVKKKLGV
jgi:hypothetical protein